MIWATVTSTTTKFYRAESWDDGHDGPGVVRLGWSVDGNNWTLQPAIPWPSSGRYLRMAARDDGAWLAIGKTQTPGNAIIGNHLGKFRTDLTVTGGELCVGAEHVSGDTFRIGVVVSNLEWKTWLVNVMTLDSALESTAKVPNGWIDGWIDFKNGTPIWVPNQRSIVSHGHKLGIYGLWGQDYIGQSFVDYGIDAIDSVTGQLYQVCRGQSNIPAYAATLNGTIVVAFCADVPQFVSSADFIPIASSPNVPPPVPVPTPTPEPIPTPVPQPEPTMPDLSTFRFADVISTPDGGNVQRFARTATLGPDTRFARDTMSTPYDKSGQWPALPIGPDGSLVDGNQWFLVAQGGKWVAGISEWLRPGQTDKDFPADYLFNDPNGTFYDEGRFGPLYRWHPKIGEVVGVFVTTPARGGVKTVVQERSNVVFLQFQPDRSAVIVGSEAGSTQPTPPPVPVPTPTPVPVPQPTPSPSGDIAGLLLKLHERIDAIDARQKDIDNTALRLETAAKDVAKAADDVHVQLAKGFQGRVNTRLLGPITIDLMPKA
jgi:hypothetical protein